MLDGSDVEPEVLQARRGGATRRECAKLAGYSLRIINRILLRNPKVEEEYNAWLSRRAKQRVQQVPPLPGP